MRKRLRNARFFLTFSILLSALALPSMVFADEPVAFQGIGASSQKLADGNTVVHFTVRVAILRTPLVFNYHWERSDGAKSQVQIQSVQQSTVSVPISTTWDLGPGAPQGEVWEQLFVKTGNTHPVSDPVKIVLQ